MLYKSAHMLLKKKILLRILFFTFSQNNLSVKTENKFARAQTIIIKAGLQIRKKCSDVSSSHQKYILSKMCVRKAHSAVLLYIWQGNVSWQWFGWRRGRSGCGRLGLNSNTALITFMDCTMLTAGTKDVELAAQHDRGLKGGQDLVLLTNRHLQTSCNSSSSKY